VNQKLEAILVGAVALVALLVMDAYVRDSPTPQNDELIYHKMASQPFETHTFVFAYRVAVPTLVHVMPFSHGFSFSLLAWLFTAGCASLTYLLLRRSRSRSRLRRVSDLRSRSAPRCSWRRCGRARTSIPSRCS
jgi:hypothetical protein